jgi:hypothetical protein
LGRGVHIIIDNIYYKTLRDAAEELGVHETTISKRVKSNEIQYQNYQYSNVNIKTSCIRPVLIDDIFYKSATYASQETGICRATICTRIKSPNPKFSGYKYADTNTYEVMPSLHPLIEDDADNHEV